MKAPAYNRNTMVTAIAIFALLGSSAAHATAPGTKQFRETISIPGSGWSWPVVSGNTISFDALASAQAIAFPVGTNTVGCSGTFSNINGLCTESISPSGPMTFSLKANPGYILTGLKVDLAWSHTSFHGTATLDATLTLNDGNATASPVLYSSFTPTTSIPPYTGLSAYTGHLYSDVIPLNGSISGSIDYALTAYANPSWAGSIGNGQEIYTSSINSLDRVELTVFTQAVPEPEVWAMLLAGLGLISCVARKRNACSKTA